MMIRVNSQIFTNSLYIWFFKFFIKTAIIGKAIFRKIEKIMYRVNLKDPEIQPSYHFCNFPSKMADLRWNPNFLNVAKFSLSQSGKGWVKSGWNMGQIWVKSGWNLGQIWVKYGSDIIWVKNFDKNFIKFLGRCN